MRTQLNKGASGIRIALVLVLLVGLSGCGRSITSTPGDAPNLEEWVAEVKARPAPPLDPLPVRDL
jgi:type IV pilus assembly protein PilP